MYKERTSGNCGDSGGGWGKITSAAACGAGAAALGWDSNSFGQERPADTHFDSRSYGAEVGAGCAMSTGYGLNFFEQDYIYGLNICQPMTDLNSDDSGAKFKCLCKLKCQPGTYKDQSDQTSCKTCPSGKVQPLAGKNYCFPGCPKDFYESNSECVACASGLISPAGSKSSSDCTNDQFAVYTERTSGNCGDSAGGESKITSAVACEAGAAAYGWSDTTATTESKASSWPPACYFYDGNLRFNTENPDYSCLSNEKCLCTITCQPNTYQDEIGQTSCKTCPSGKSQPSPGKNYCQINRRLLNTELNSMGDGPSIAKPQTIQNEQTVTAGEEIPKIENEKISSNLKNPIQQSTDEICEAWLAEKQEKNVTNTWPFHRFALEQRRQVIRSLESAARPGFGKCTTAETDAISTCESMVPVPNQPFQGDDLCSYTQAMFDCRTSCYCNDPAADAAIKDSEDAMLASDALVCTLQCKSKTPPPDCSMYNPALPSQFMQYIIYLIIFLWLKDLLILRSLLDSTTIELKSTLNIVPTEWSEPWACYLNTEDEAKIASDLLRGFSRSYSRKPKRR